MSVSFLRHAGWFNPEYTQQKTLNIIGCGATGSNIGLLCAKMGWHSFRVWDADIVESHNLPNQIFASKDINSLKVDAFERILKEFNPLIEVEKHPYFFTSEHEELLTDGPLLLTVDTMSARHEIYDCFENNLEVEKVFETRVGFTYAEVNILDNFNTSHLQEWKSTLKTDNEIVEAPCNMRIIATLTGMVSAYTAHRICDSMRANFLNEKFEYKKKTIFNFDENQNISTYAIA